MVFKVLGAALLLAALTACSSTPAPPAAPPKPTMRDLATVDVCGLLTAGDFTAGFDAPPAPGTRSCDFRPSDQSGKVLVRMSIVDESYEQAKARVQEGAEQQIDGRKAWWATQFEGAGDTRVGAADMVTELKADRVLVTRVEHTPGDRGRVANLARTTTEAALHRLVVTA